MSIVEPPEPSAAARVSLRDEAHVEKLTLIDHVTDDVRIEGRRQVTWPHRVGVVPPVADGYQRRDVATALLGELSAGATRVLAGLGGIGKTQLAAAYTEDSWATGELDLLVWVTAASREALLAGYALAAWDVAGALERASRRNSEPRGCSPGSPAPNRRWLVKSPAQIRWVKGQAGHPLNDAADRLAVQTRRYAQLGGAPENIRGRLLDRIVAGSLTLSPVG
jgi:hypothetical protein